jgi:hypothetical protein
MLATFIDAPQPAGGMFHVFNDLETYFLLTATQHGTNVLPATVIGVPAGKSSRGYCRGYKLGSHPAGEFGWRAEHPFDFEFTPIVLPDGDIRLDGLLDDRSNPAVLISAAIPMGHSVLFVGERTPHNTYVGLLFEPRAVTSMTKDR